MPTIKELKNYLETLDDEDIVAYDIWQVEDVELRQDELSVKLTKEECEEVLEEMYNGFDANYGLCWDIMGAHIADIANEKGEEV